MLKLAAAQGRPQDVFQPVPAPPPPEPPPPPPPPPQAPPPPRAFEPELGPEPTQIGAMPLITFGDTPLASLVGEAAPRPSAPNVMPNATGIALAGPEPAGGKSKRLPLMIGIGVGAVAIIILIIVLAS
jgi:hypothetical protein